MMNKVAFFISLVALMFSIMVFGITILNMQAESVTSVHPDYKMEATYDKEARTIFWKGIDFKESPLGKVHVKCECGNHSNI